MNKIKTTSPLHQTGKQLSQDSQQSQPDSRLHWPDSQLDSPDSRLESPDSRLDRPDHRLDHPDNQPFCLPMSRSGMTWGGWWKGCSRPSSFPGCSSAALEQGESNVSTVVKSKDELMRKSLIFFIYYSIMFIHHTVLNLRTFLFSLKEIRALGPLPHIWSNKNITIGNRKSGKATQCFSFHFLQVFFVPFLFIWGFSPNSFFVSFPILKVINSLKWCKK